MKKDLFIDQELVNEVLKNKSERKVTKTQKRSHVIIPEFLGATIAIHNGKTYVTIFVVEDMIGHKLGEFALTRKLKPHKVKKTEISNKKKGTKNFKK